MDNTFTHVVDAKALTLTTTGLTESGQEAQVEIFWDTAEAMAEKLEETKGANEAHILNIDKLPEGYYDPTRTRVMKSNVKRKPLPFGLVLNIGKSSGHSYDEAAVALGLVKIKANITAKGALDLRTVSVAPVKRKGSLLFGFGGAHSSRFLSIDHK